MRPGLPPEGIPRTPKEGEVNGFTPVLRQYAEEQGLKLKRSPILPCSRPALEVAEYAKEQGRFEQFHLAIFKAYWEEAKNIGLRSVIREAAEKSGLDIAGVERCLDNGLYTQTVIEQSEEAKESGINTIPAYVIGGLLLEGVQPYEFFQKAMEFVQGENK